MTTATKQANRIEAAPKWNWPATCLLATAATVFLAAIAVAQAAQLRIAVSDFQLNEFGALAQMWFWWLGPLLIGIGGLVASGMRRDVGQSQSRSSLCALGVIRGVRRFGAPRCS